MLAVSEKLINLGLPGFQVATQAYSYQAPVAWKLVSIVNQWLNF